MNENNYMELAIEHAKKAASLNEVPVGAVLVDEKNQEVLSFRHNEIVSQNNCLNHAEILVIEEACKLKKYILVPMMKKKVQLKMVPAFSVIRITFSQRYMVALKKKNVL